MSNVLVIFQANTEHTEQLALAVGVGAVESEANIRLRRLVAAGAVEVGHKGYGTLKEPDLLWADTAVIGLEDARAKTEELDGLLPLLSAVTPGSLHEKRAWTFNAEAIGAAKTEAQLVVESALQAAGITVLPAPMPNADEMLDQMKQVGRQLGRG